MTGMEAWSLIAPTIASELITTREGTEAYVLLFGSLKEHDEMEKHDEEVRKKAASDFAVEAIKSYDEDILDEPELHRIERMVIKTK